uniref:Uncharacterized protein n=1 Tax=Arundo donax TaxID=35708 RepID=A0A0A9H9I0_ARUDO
MATECSGKIASRWRGPRAVASSKQRAAGCHEEAARELGFRDYQVRVRTPLTSVWSRWFVSPRDLCAIRVETLNPIGFILSFDRDIEILAGVEVLQILNIINKQKKST